MATEKLPQGLYVFLVYTIDHELIGAFGAREDADSAAKTYLEGGDSDPPPRKCKKNFDKFNEETGRAFWSWYNASGEVTIEMTKLQ